MSMTRFFVTNLPTNTSETELNELFNNYGSVKLVDIKSKANALEPGNINSFAFVTLQINADDVQYCLNELKWQKLRGAKIKISLAKESFLERLKRERDENEQSPGVDTNTINEEKSDLLSQNLQNTRRIFNEDEDLNEEDIDVDLLITKKRASRSLQNGKITIGESGFEPIHVIEKPRKAKCGLNAIKDTPAEKKRKESQNKMKNQYDQKKNTIQVALANLNGAQSKKIKFSDAEEDDDKAPIKSKTNIFDSDNDDDKDNIDVLKIGYGQKGERLAELQSRHQSLDPRFKINENFVENEERIEMDDDKNQENENEEDERKWQLNILEQVVGYKLDTETAAQKAAKNKQMLRFDPSKASHKKMLLPNQSDNVEEIQYKRRKKQMNDSTVVETKQNQEKSVSKDVFYMVSDTLTDALKSRGEGFSLLNMFGRQAATTELEQREDQLKQLKDERILVNKLQKSGAAGLDYESSSSGEDDDFPSKNINGRISANTKQHVQKSDNKAKGGIMFETFFFTKKDERLKEGANFFSFDKSQISGEDYEPVRKRLNMLIKKKIIKTQKSQIGVGRKLKRGKKKI